MKSEGYRFGDCVVNSVTKELLLAGTKVDIQPKVYRLIEYLIENRARIVSKDELQEQVWDGSFITDTALTRAIMKARKAIGDDAQNQALIKTIHGEGYRFIADLEVVTEPITSFSEQVDTPTPQEKPTASTSLWRYAAVAVVIIAVIVSAISLRQDHENRLIRLAVMPFDVISDTEDYNWVSLGLMSLVNQQLSKELGVSVVSSRRIISSQDQIAADTESDSGDRQLRALLNDVDGASHFVQYQLSSTPQGLELNYVITDLSGKAIATDQFHGDTPTLLARASLHSVAKALGISQSDETVQRIISDDPFLNEAYSRGLALQLSGKAEEALNYFKIASDMEPELFWPRYEYALSMRILGNNEEAEKLLIALESQAQSLEEKISIANALGLLYWRMSKMSEAKSYLESGLAQAQESGFTEKHAILLGNLAIMAKNESEFEKSRTYLGRALALYQELGTSTPPGWLSNTLAGLYVNEGNFNEAVIHFEQAIAYFRKVQNERNLATSLGGYSGALIKMGRYDKAERLLTESHMLRQKINDQRGIASVLIDLSDLNVSRGRFTIARDHLEQVQNNSMYEKSNPIKMAVLRRKASLSIQDGSYEQGLNALKEAEEIALATNSRLITSNIHMQRIELLIAEGRETDIAVRLDDLMSQLSLNGYTRLMIKGYKLKAEIAKKANDPDSAIGFYKEAIAHANTIRDRLGRARAEIDLAELYLETNDVSSAESLVALLASEFDYLYQVKLLRAHLAELLNDKQRALDYLQQAKDIANERWSDEHEQRLQKLSQPT